MRCFRGKPARQDARDFDGAGHLSKRSGIPREADVYLRGPARFMTDMKEVLAALGMAPERVHMEIFNGSEPLTPGVVDSWVVGATTRAPQLPKNDADIGPLVGHAGIAPHGLYETAPRAVQRFRLGANSVRVKVPVQGGMELPAVQANEHSPTDPPGSNSVFGNLQG
jgi:hypothetical protein